MSGCSKLFPHSTVHSRYPKRNRAANNNSAENSDEDVDGSAAAGGGGADSNSCVGEVIDSDSSSRKSEIR